MTCERRAIMADNNEIDNILNEIKSRRGGDYGASSTNDEGDRVTKKPSESVLSDTFDIKETDGKNSASLNNFSLINDSLDKPVSAQRDKPMTKKEKSKKGRKKQIIIAAAVILIIIIAAVIFAVVKGSAKEEETTAVSTTAATTQEAIIITNPLTGSSNFSADAVGRRSVACVVENAYDARPQWGIDDIKNPPDIIVEGEVEGGETRMLWIYADYNSLPSQIGPIRSARPPFIKFSQLFDSIFIHWGMSTSKGDYIGADSVFSSENVDHINQMAFNDSLGLFGRDSSRGVSSEHTGVLYGDKLAQTIENTGFRTEADSDSYTTFSFYESDTAVGASACSSLKLTFSKSTLTRSWSYSTEDKMYHSTDYQTDVERKNILVLYDTTAYVIKYDYKGSGSSETYCDYKLAGGNGKLASLGTVCDVTWSVENGRLSVKASNGNDISLNVGTTWIGWASSNNGGSCVTE